MAVFAFMQLKLAEKCVNHDKNIRDAQKLPKYLMSLKNILFMNI